MVKLKILLEWSKNEPIPEITQFDSKLAIFIFGPPGAGKTTFVKDSILTKNNKFKIINPDDISYIKTGDITQSKYYKKSPDMALKMAKAVSKGGSNIVYDSTGNSYDRIKEAVESVRMNGYTIVFIHLIAPLHVSVSQNSARERIVPYEYLELSYKKSQSLISKFSTELKPDSYYVILNLSQNYKFFKYENGHLLKHKVDKYVKMEESKI